MQDKQKSCQNYGVSKMRSIPGDQLLMVVSLAGHYPLYFFPKGTIDPHGGLQSRPFDVLATETHESA